MGGVSQNDLQLPIFVNPYHAKPNFFNTNHRFAWEGYQKSYQIAHFSKPSHAKPSFSSKNQRFAWEGCEKCNPTTSVHLNIDFGSSAAEAAACK